VDPFWQNAYDDDKDRRYGALFFVTLLVLFGALALLGVAVMIAGSNSAYADDLGPVLLVCVVICTAALVCSVAKWIRGRKQRKEALKYSTLSRDELAKARSKLKTRMQPVTFRRASRPPRRPPPRRPDTDLKY